MITVPIATGQYFKCINYCSKHISEQKYHLHSRVGGEGWSVSSHNKQNSSIVMLATVPDEYATIIALKFSESNYEYK
jgi:hypothetical protein